MPKWSKETARLKQDHTWKAPPGYNIFLVDRGAVRFNIPERWIVEPDSDCIKFYDGRPPNDNCRLACSYIRLAPIDWSGVSLAELIRVAGEGDGRTLTPEGVTVEPARRDLEVAWGDFSYIDPGEKRPALSRICIGRGLNIQTLITLDYWPEDAQRLAPVWNEVVRSLQLGAYVADPTAGDVLH
jgi:hypothetical protein